MQELKVIGVEDGALLVATEDGARFRIVVDDVLQSRIRQAQPEQHQGPKIPPREIQAHIRSGLSAEDVAEITGAAVEYIRRFEGPVVAEREHIVNSALAVPVATAIEPDGDEPASFGSAIRDRLARLGASGERWASWKDEERGWMVKLEFTVDEIEHDARWSFEPRKQALQPLNSEAITLSQQGELKGGLIPRLRAVDGDASRFDSGAFTLEEPEHGEFDTAPQLEPLPYARSTPQSSPAVTRAAIKRADEPAPVMGETADLLEALRRRRGERESAGETASRPAEPTPLLEQPELPLPAEPVAPSSPKAKKAESGEDRPAKAARGLWGGKQQSSGRGDAAPAKKSSRASMPSWDEIVFGARPDDDLA
ncbi:septation protein SepH [Agromyces soli]|uniref:Septation protein SepH n=1 Tax=Agromyces soli TaxID=659012 RepID=A0ABY4AQ53_9MICO|nr:septation protein SepH [Agromyces soli]UOE25301.1 septation protein SepH [Agromyces soli]